MIDSFLGRPGWDAASGQLILRWDSSARVMSSGLSRMAICSSGDARRLLPAPLMLRHQSANGGAQPVSAYQRC
jgi:hypothetical protein